MEWEGGEIGSSLRFATPRQLSSVLISTRSNRSAGDRRTAAHSAHCHARRRPPFHSRRESRCYAGTEPICQICHIHTPRSPKRGVRNIKTLREPRKMGVSRDTGGGQPNYGTSVGHLGSRAVAMGQPCEGDRRAQDAPARHFGGAGRDRAAPEGKLHSRADRMIYCWISLCQMDTKEEL